MPVSLILDDGVPVINALYYFRLQVNQKEFDQHVSRIPLDFLEQFAGVVQKWGLRGKFTVIPYPAGLGSILEGWEGCDQTELESWLALARSAIAPHFDITPEILTHTLALDLKTRHLLPEPEHIWMAGRNRAELSDYMGTAVGLLRQAGFTPTGITQPCYFKGDRPSYDQAVLEAIRPPGGDPAGTAAFYFIDFCPDKAPVPPHPVVLLNRERGEAVVSMLAYADDYFWNSQYPNPPGVVEMADELITTDGKAGRLVELMQAGAWATFCTHWQSQYSNGSRQGLAGLEEVARRLANTFGARLLWMTNGEMARYRAAEEALRTTWLDECTLQLDSAFACPDFTLTLSVQALAGPGQAVKRVELASGQGAIVALRRAATGAGDGLMAPGSWQPDGERLTVCFDLQRGMQALKLL
ncbi:MAG: hypothetical protein ABSE06_13935 [Anaerolineaceae bacterium]|jgi:hypothetical protein